MNAHTLETLCIEVCEGSGPPPILVPHLDDDVHDIEGLLRVHRYLFATGAEREAMIAAAVS